MDDQPKCPVCNSENTEWTLSGALICKDEKLIYEWITKETINNPSLINFAKVARAYRKIYLLGE